MTISVGELADELDVSAGDVIDIARQIEGSELRLDGFDVDIETLEVDGGGRLDDKDELELVVPDNQIDRFRWLTAA